MIAASHSVSAQAPALGRFDSLRRRTNGATVVRAQPQERSSSSSSSSSSPLDRRAVLLSLGVLLGAGSTGDAEAAKSDAYYAELSANAGINSGDLMSRYSSLGADGKKASKSSKGGRSAPSKNVAKNAEVLGLKPSAKPSAKATPKAAASKGASPKPAVKPSARKASR